MLNESVKSAERSTEQINIGKAEPAHVAARTGFVRVKSVKKLTEEPVYNMEVENTHNFAVSDGLIVHNCIDATRYALERVWRRRGQ